MKTITITLPLADAEPILHTHAMQAARYGALCDFITRKTIDAPGTIYLPGRYDSAVKEWRGHFQRAKRIVESFGLEYSQTSEQETMTVYYPHKGGTTHKGALGFNIVTGSEPDYSKPIPKYNSRVHADACIAAADRVVRAWKASL